MALTTETRAALQKLRDYCQAALDVDAVLAEPEPKPVEVDLEAWKIAQQNRILASAPDSAKAALVGTLSTEPTVTAKALTDVACDATLAESLVTFGATARKAALDLTKTLEAIK